MVIPSLEQIKKTQAERSYFEFFKQAWEIAEPDTPLQLNFHLKYICEILEKEVRRIIAGKPKTKDIIINIPPRSLKSSMVTIFLNAWAWTISPSLKFITPSYGADLATDLSVKTRRIIESQWYQDNWGDKVKLCTDQNVKSHFENTLGGIRKSVGVGGAVTGSGADIIPIDDPLNPLDANSEAKRKECITWFRETISSRLNDKKVGVRILIMQRLHEEDLTGWILANQKNKWVHICLPVNDDFNISPKELESEYKNGLFFPDRFTKEIIESDKEEYGSYGFAGQMGQNPVPAGGGIFQREWFNYYDEPPPKMRRSFWSWDTAAKDKEKNDYVVGQYWGIFDKGYYLLNVVRLKMLYPETKRTIEINFNSRPSNAVLLEDKSTGEALIPDLKNSTALPIIGVIPIKDKVTRAHMASPTVEAGKIYIPKNAKWTADYIAEMTTFPFSKNDDQVDATTQFINYIAPKKNLKSLLGSFKGGGKMEADNI
ncbi:MAG: phage terminase large subunit [Elusimicrobiales bacterium]|nr:phage terminase large subunit [Elusimicrobiales bacterium]